MLRKNTTIIPVLRINNRSINQAFLETQLGIKTRLEEGAFAECGDRVHSETKLVLMESPGVRTRAVQGLKKVNKIVIRVRKAQELENLLARGTSYTKLYKGKNGYGFEAISPEGDTFLLHAEQSADNLQAILPPVSFSSHQDDFQGLSEFEIEAIWIHTPQPSVSQEFYRSIFSNASFLHFVEAEGPDLLTPAAHTWDMDSFRFSVEPDFSWTELEDKLDVDFFKDKKERFIQTVDPSGIELWFEK